MSSIVTNSERFFLSLSDSATVLTRISAAESFSDWYFDSDALFAETYLLSSFCTEMLRLEKEKIFTKLPLNLQTAKLQQAVLEF